MNFDLRARYPAIAFTVLLLLLGSVSLVVPQSARAGAFLASCIGTSNSTYTPGLTDSVQTETFSATQTFSCLPVVGDPGLTGGQASSGGTFALSCVDLLEAGFPPSDATYTWNDGTQSVVQYSTSAISNNPAGALVIVQTGSVLSGTGQGATVVQTITLISENVLELACLTPQGVQTLTGPITLSFVEP